MENSEPTRFSLSQVIAIALLSGSLTFSYLYSRLDGPQQARPAGATRLAQAAAAPSTLAENIAR